MRKIFQTAEFSAQVADLEEHGTRVRDFLRALKAKLQRNPEFGTKVRDDPPLWFVPTPDIIQQPLCASYTFDDDRIILISLWISERGG